MYFDLLRRGKMVNLLLFRQKSISRTSIMLINVWWRVIRFTRMIWDASFIETVIATPNITRTFIWVILEYFGFPSTLTA